ncbi:Basal-body rod modification protein FlgD (plasmid) [Piscirickettsia salmonis]|uniref:Basal-body rod modification protein FlgD n=1 Tax=Piscirickettsia salmonis TaxID=1238 RepID=A0A6I5Y627_PISSA|nr:flagellar hook assembly protein FlgD [Piscirickettsia salmonis]AKP74206.1 flagellar biosynthesis protein FlgD [Piscirickettsia salmonis LF-89 = ATCC VR-1361]ALB23098.1 flagellar basal body rod modification protein FlgD [Piscirickettsia salmonis]ALY03033.1 flagellar biosynthesis protein FlgD [Piscirickettsia salmonis]AMA42591.1 flagellar biosynthesis protein FlgD [Piscirickettsia salmonis]AOS35061.1 flagellar biosynthesis protein FlgD [Piscirickettsia salmonis]
MAEINSTDSVANLYKNLGLTSSDATLEKKELGQDDFLKLLTTQLKHQDPMQPQENGEFLAQMAQFSTVDGINSINDAVGSLVAELKSTTALQASALVGRSVLAESDKGLLIEGEEFKADIEVPKNAKEVKVNIFTDGGSLVRQVEIGDLADGNYSFVWDGKDENGNVMPAGRYQFAAEARVEGETQQLPLAVYANIDSVILGKNGEETQVSLSGIGQVGISGIKQLG